MTTFTNKKPSSLEGVEQAMLKQTQQAQVEPQVNQTPNQVEPPAEPVVDPVEPMVNTGEPTSTQVEPPQEPQEPSSQQDDGNTPEPAEDPQKASDGVISDWDTPPVEPDTSKTVDEAKLELAKELGIDLSPDKSLSEQIAEKYKTQPEDVLANVPEQLKKAIELANKGIDYEQYLNINKVDYDAISDADLYASAVVDFFRNEDGTVNEDALQDHIDSYSDSQLRVEAHKVRRDLKSQQQALNKMLESEAQEAKQKMVAEVDQYLSNFKSVNNFKVNDYQKNKIKEAIIKNNGSLERDLFYTNGKPDYAKMIDVKFKVDNFDKIVGYLQTQNRNEGKRQVLEGLSNVQTPANGEPVLNGASRKPKSAQSLLLDEIKAKYQQ